MNSTKLSASILAHPDLDPDLLPPLEMDGYLTGILVTPDLDAEQWVAGLWKQIPDFTDERRLHAALVSALARRKTIETELQKGWPAFRPGFSEIGKKADHDKVRIWVRGFWKAMRLDPEYWADLAQDERTASFIGLFVGFMDMLEDIEEREDADELRDEHAALMPRALVGMRKLALMREGNARALTSMKATKVGRNAPCPCGSGQKFKRCCSAN
ncbi:YecA family protein [Sphingomonas oligophenolica]|uniref:UPF0149 family protein n=1 Tax=Sphingomonas oligophenolica TaxID=301154 RepID=A0ABU9YCY7_9SPHN